MPNCLCKDNKMIERKKLILIVITVIAIVLCFLYESTLLYWCTVALLFMACLVLGKREKRIMNPFFLFSITPFTLLIYKNISNVYMMDLESDTWRIAIINIAAFVFVMALAPEAKIEYEIAKDYVGNRKLEPHAIALGIIGIGPMFLYGVFGIAIPFYTIFGLLSVPALCCSIVSKNRYLTICLMLLTLLTWTNNVSKSTILTTSLCILICYELYFSKSRKNKIIFALMCILGLIMMILAFSYANQVRGVRTAEDQLNYYIRYGDVRWNGIASLFMPYMYLETPWTNLQYVMQTQDVRTYGLWLLKPFLNYLQIDAWFEDLYQLMPMSSFNTFSFIACNFKDFGFCGSVISSLLLGSYTKWVYSRATKTKNPLDIACWIYVAQAVLEMFFSNHFFQQAYPLTCVLLLGIYKKVFHIIKSSRGKVTKIGHKRS